MGRRDRRGRGGPYARTDADGAFRLEGLGAGLQRIRLTLDEAYLGPREVSLAIGTTDARIRYERGGVLAGRVMGPDGEGVGNVELAAMPADGSRTNWKNGRSQEDGSFRIVGLARDEAYVVRARPWERDVGRADLLHAYVREVRPDREDLVLRLLPGVYVEGTLLLPDGAPAAGCTVGAFAEGEEEGKGPATVDEHGAFRIGPFAPGASVTVNGYAMERTVRPAWVRGVRAPASGVVLRLALGGSRAGRVRGENLAGFRWMWVATAAAEGVHTCKGEVEADGRFLLTQLPDEGTVTLYVFGRKDDRQALIERVAVAGEPLEVALAEGLAIAGRVDVSLRRPGRFMPLVEARSVSLGLERHATVDAGGGFRIRGLPPGRYELTFLDMQNATLARAEVDAGDEDVLLR